ncbi:hypothetical protein BT69DRAFT_1377176 [Atractiella rhizophila]|nr:hypothetical protein BT69DRAFT_1377176 [Atractiella rhizophila]
MAVITDMPPEILSIIMTSACSGDRFDRRDRANALKSYSLVSKEWSGCAQRLLLRDIVVSSFKTADTVRTMSRQNSNRNAGLRLTLPVALQSEWKELGMWTNSSSFPPGIAAEILRNFWRPYKRTFPNVVSAFQATGAQLTSLRLALSHAHEQMLPGLLKSLTGLKRLELLPGEPADETHWYYHRNALHSIAIVEAIEQFEEVLKALSRTVVELFYGGFGSVPGYKFNYREDVKDVLHSSLRNLPNLKHIVFFRPCRRNYTKDLFQCLDDRNNLSTAHVLKLLPLDEVLAAEGVQVFEGKKSKDSPN